MIKTIVFDIGEVLIDFEWKDYLDRIVGEDAEPHVTNATFGTGYWHELDRAVLSEGEILELFYSAEPDYRAEIKEMFDRIGECVGRRDWAIPFLEDLKSRGYRVLFLSNMSEHVMGSNPGAYDFESHMDGGIYSCDVHLIKPDKAIYRKLFETYDLDPLECLFVDDNPNNVAVARELGMKAIRFEDHDQLVTDLDKALQKDAGHDRVSVLCYGDSNTFGYDPYTGGRYPYEKRWTTLLAGMLGGRYEVINEGMNGRTTAYDRPGAGWKNGVSSFISCLATHKPVDYIIIMLGTNDCIEALGLSAEAIAGGMETLVRITEEETPALQGYVPRIIVAAPAPVQGDLAASPFGLEMTGASMQRSRDIAPLYKDIAERHKCGYVNGDTAEVSPDCLHLTEAGHSQMARLMYDAISQTDHQS